MMKINKKDVVKMAGIAGTVLSLGATLLTSYSNKKEQEELIDRKVNEALSNMNNSLVENK